MSEMTLEQRIAAVVARRWAADGHNAEVDANALVIDLVAEVNAIAAERAAEVLEQAATWLDGDPDKGGAPYITESNAVLFPHRLDIAEVVTWASESLRDRASAIRRDAAPPT